MSQVDILSAKKEHLDDLVLIENACFKTDIISRRQMRYILTKAKAFILLAKIKSEPVAYCICFTPLLPRPARLYSLGVLKEYRKGGIANSLIKSVINRLHTLGYSSCNLEVRNKDKQAKNLYTKNNFREIKILPTYYQDGEDGIKMKKILKKLNQRGGLIHEYY